MVSVSLTKVSTCSFEKMPIYEVGFAVFPVAEESCSKRFRAFPKATQQEGAEPGFPPLAHTHRSMFNPTLQVPT